MGFSKMRCVVEGCQGRGGHIFPRNVKRKAAWLTAIKWAASNGDPHHHAVVCHQHFLETDYRHSQIDLQTFSEYGSLGKNRRLRLKRTAVPSVFPSQCSRQIVTEQDDGELLIEILDRNNLDIDDRVSADNDCETIIVVGDSDEHQTHPDGDDVLTIEEDGVAVDYPRHGITSNGYEEGMDYDEEGDFQDFSHIVEHIRTKLTEEDSVCLDTNQGDVLIKNAILTYVECMDYENEDQGTLNIEEMLCNEEGDIEIQSESRIPVSYSTEEEPVDDVPECQYDECNEYQHLGNNSQEAEDRSHEMHIVDEVEPHSEIQRAATNVPKSKTRPNPEAAFVNTFKMTKKLVQIKPNEMHGKPEPAALPLSLLLPLPKITLKREGKKWVVGKTRARQSRKRTSNLLRHKIANKKPATPRTKNQKGKVKPAKQKRVPGKRIVKPKRNPKKNAVPTDASPQRKSLPIEEQLPLEDLPNPPSTAPECPCIDVSDDESYTSVKDLSEDHHQSPEVPLQRCENNVVSSIQELTQSAKTPSPSSSHQPGSINGFRTFSIKHQILQQAAAMTFSSSTAKQWILDQLAEREQAVNSLSLSEKPTASSSSSDERWSDLEFTAPCSSVTVSRHSASDSGKHKTANSATSGLSIPKKIANRRSPSKIPANKIVQSKICQKTTTSSFSHVVPSKKINILKQKNTISINSKPDNRDEVTDSPLLSKAYEKGSPGVIRCDEDIPNTARFIGASGDNTYYFLEDVQFSLPKETLQEMSKSPPSPPREIRKLVEEWGDSDDDEDYPYMIPDQKKASCPAEVSDDDEDCEILEEPFETIDLCNDDDDFSDAGMGGSSEYGDPIEDDKARHINVIYRKARARQLKVSGIRRKGTVAITKTNRKIDNTKYYQLNTARNHAPTGYSKVSLAHPPAQTLRYVNDDSEDPTYIDEPYSPSVSNNVVDANLLISSIGNLFNSGDMINVTVGKQTVPAVSPVELRNCSASSSQKNQQKTVAVPLKRLDNQIENPINLPAFSHAESGLVEQSCVQFPPSQAAVPPFDSSSFHTQILQLYNSSNAEALDESFASHTSATSLNTHSGAKSVPAIEEATIGGLESSIDELCLAETSDEITISPGGELVASGGSVVALEAVLDEHVPDSVASPVPQNGMTSPTPAVASSVSSSQNEKLAQCSASVEFPTHDELPPSLTTTPPPSLLPVSCSRGNVQGATPMVDSLQDHDPSATAATTLPESPWTAQETPVKPISRELSLEHPCNAVSAPVEYEDCPDASVSALLLPPPLGTSYVTEESCSSMALSSESPCELPRQAAAQPGMHLTPESAELMPSTELLFSLANVADQIMHPTSELHGYYKDVVDPDAEQVASQLVLGPLDVVDPDAEQVASELVLGPLDVVDPDSEQVASELVLGPLDVVDPDSEQVASELVPGPLDVASEPILNIAIPSVNPADNFVLVQNDETGSGAEINVQTEPSVPQKEILVPQKEMLVPQRETLDLADLDAEPFVTVTMANVPSVPRFTLPRPTLPPEPLVIHPISKSYRQFVQDHCYTPFRKVPNPKRRLKQNNEGWKKTLTLIKEALRRKCSVRLKRLTVEEIDRYTRPDSPPAPPIEDEESSEDDSDFGEVTAQTCYHCDQDLASLKALRKHISIKHKYNQLICPHCFAGFLCPVKCNEHIRDTHRDKASEITYACTQCDFTTNDHCALRGHMDVMHKAQRHKTCSECIFKCPSDAAMAEHMDKYHSAKSRSGDYVVSNIQDLIGEEIIPLPIGVPISDQNAIKSINVGHFAPDSDSTEGELRRTPGHGRPMAGLIEPRAQATSDVLKVPCPDCTLVFRNLADLGKHIVVVHEKFRCPFSACHKPFQSAKSLKSHMRTHIVPRCPVCRLQFDTKYKVVTHVNLVHGQEAASCFLCRTCPFASTRTSALKLHHIVIHQTSNFPTKCPLCVSTSIRDFSNIKELLLHTSRVHSADHNQVTWGP